MLKICQNFTPNIAKLFEKILLKKKKKQKSQILRKSFLKKMTSSRERKPLIPL
jgi:hypothetical protein